VNLLDFGGEKIGVGKSAALFTRAAMERPDPSEGERKKEKKKKKKKKKTKRRKTESPLPRTWFASKEGG